MTPFEIGGLSEDEARTEFMRYRFHKTGGKPYCERCDCTAVHTYKTRPIFKCKMCLRQFSATSGTPWAYKKLPFRKLMYLISCLNLTAQTRSIREICRDIRVQYKTALLWVHKVNEEIAAAAAAHVLCGEVEADGAAIAGSIRPKNTAKDRRDLRRYPFRSKERELCVVVARERNGAVRTWITKREGDVRQALRRALDPKAVLFTDLAPHWSWFRSWHQVFQVNHSKEYYTPEACTNFAESFFAGLRSIARVHRHIAQNYLDLYVAAAAWRVQRNRWSDTEGFRSLMVAMSRSGLSPLRGYFQGRKRACVLTQEDGSTCDWRPPTPEERRRARAAATGREQPAAYRPVRSRDWSAGFRFVSAAEFVDDSRVVPETSGVYALMFRDGEALLQNLGHCGEPDLPHWVEQGYLHLYTGETYALRSRLREHLQGDVRDSTLRETLMAAQWRSSALGAGGPDMSAVSEEVERTLSLWLSDQVLIGFKACGYVRDVEAEILRARASPLNIARRPPSAFANSLSELRRDFRLEVLSNWPPGPSKRRTIRR
ncbi:MAG: IS1595 family transposase [Phenylobacterium sp.]|uniref:IS1595 family transposase n=1 Tax=Phenylobacterium sp. TaxID=1871053 RepID=UPI003918C740